MFTRRPTTNYRAAGTAGVILILGLLAAAVALSYADRSLEFIVGLLSAVGSVGVLLVPVIGKLFALADETQAQSKTLDAISDQTDPGTR